MKKYSFTLLWVLILSIFVSACTSEKVKNKKEYDRIAMKLATFENRQPMPVNKAVPPPEKQAGIPPQSIASTPKALPEKQPVKIAPPVEPPPAKPVVKNVTPAPVEVLPPPVVRPTPVPTPVVEGHAGTEPSVAFAETQEDLLDENLVDPERSAVAYSIRRGDMLKIALRGIPTPQVVDVFVDEYGQISLPFINEIDAEGVTASDLERHIRQAYLDRQIYRNVTVNISVPARYYFMEGEFKQPGRYQLFNATRLSQAIAAAGYTEYANGRVQITRGDKIITVKNAKRLDRNPQENIFIEAGDVIKAFRTFW